MAARDPERARAFARRHGLPRAHDSYRALVEDPEIDAVYVALPNALHAEWTERALAEGKHVLCEKPLASNAAEAERIAAEVDARKPGLIVMEALHYRHHPLAARAREIVASGEIGAVRSVEARFCVPLLSPRDIRYRYDLAGGATMDLGCYAIDLIRLLGDAAAMEVTSAVALLADDPRIDRAMEADFRLRGADGSEGTASMRCSLRSRTLLSLGATVVGDAGALRLVNPFLPHFYARCEVRGADGRLRRFEPVPREATYDFQLRAFARAARGDGPVVTDAAHAAANLRVIDAVYEKAGLPRRGM